MRTAGLIVSIAVLIAGLAIAGPAQAKPKKVKVATEAFIDSFEVGDDDVTFFGHINCEKRKCEKRRTIRLEQADFNIAAGSGKTDAAGNWEITFDQDVAGPGTYEATAARKKLKKKRHGEVKKIFKCRADTSEPFEATPPV
jgi:hypothetical protein